MSIAETIVISLAIICITILVLTYIVMKYDKKNKK